MTIKWNLPQVMFNAGVFSEADLRRLLVNKVNYDISAPAVHRLIKGLPKECKLATLDALCQALNCKIEDLIVFTEPTPANQCIQPLVMESSFKPPTKTTKQKAKKKFNFDLPPI